MEINLVVNYAAGRKVVVVGQQTINFGALGELQIQGMTGTLTGELGVVRDPETNRLYLGLVMQPNNHSFGTCVVRPEHLEEGRRYIRSGETVREVPVEG